LAGLLFQVLVVASQCVQAADLRVLCPHALREPALDLARSYSRATGHRVEFVFASVGAIHKRAATGERADVMIGSADGIAALVKLGSADAGSEVPIARTALALAGRENASLPAPDNADAIERALLAVRVLGVPDLQRGIPGAAQAIELIDSQPSAAEVRSKIRWLVSAAEAMKLLASGGIDLALVPMGDVVSVSGVAFAGPITSPMTRGVAYAAAVPRSAAQPELGRAFLAHWRTPAAVKTLRQAGYLPAE